MPTPPRFSFSQLADDVRALVEERDLARLGTLSRVHRFVHFWTLVWRSFVRNRCPVRASALSFTSLLSMIPLLAVVLGITGLFLQSEGEQRIDRLIQGVINVVVPPAAFSTNSPVAPGVAPDPTVAMDEPAKGSEASTNPPVPSTIGATNPPVEVGHLAKFTDLARSKFAELAQDQSLVDARRTVTRYISEFIQNTRSGTLGATGMVFLLWMIYSLLSRIEETMDDIWGAPRSRNWLDRVRNYWLTVSLGPIIVAFGVGLATGPQLASVRGFVRGVPLGGPLFNLVPVALLWLAFVFFYQMMPNTKVRFGAAAVGGLISSLGWIGTNVLGSLYVSRVVMNSKIYGSLGLVPVFMLGLYTSWLILLFGAQVAYAWQNRSAYFQEKLAENVNQRGREFVALRLMTFLGQRFQRGEQPASVAAMSAELGIPSRLIQQVMETLLSARLVIEVGSEDGGYTPARPLDQLNAHHILSAMRATQGHELATRDEPVRAEVYGEFARIQEAERQAASTITLLALVHRAQARLELGSRAGILPATGSAGILPAPETNNLAAEATPQTANERPAPDGTTALTRLEPIPLPRTELPAGAVGEATPASAPVRPADWPPSPLETKPTQAPASSPPPVSAEEPAPPQPAPKFTQPTEPGFPD